MLKMHVLDFHLKREQIIVQRQICVLSRVNVANIFDNETHSHLYYGNIKFGGIYIVLK